MVIRFRELKDAKVLLNLDLFQSIISLCNYCLASICDHLKRIINGSFTLAVDKEMKFYSLSLRNAY